MSSADEPAGGQQAEGRRAMSLAYKVEELLALRDSVSESAVSIDKFADEDAVKEHVLRPSASATLVVEKHSRPLAATPSAVPSVPLKKPSPSPSIKRGKAERLLKEHGSPPGIRVTAGGRIVPSDLPPLGVARFGNIGFRPPTLRGIASDTAMVSHPSLDVNSVNNINNNNPALNFEVINGQAVVRIGDKLYAVPAIPAINVNPAPAPAAAPAPAPALASAPSVPSILSVPAVPNNPMMSSAHNGFPTMSLPAKSNGSQASSSQPSLAGVTIPELKSLQVAKRQELKNVEQTEVLQASQQSEAWRAEIIQKKKSLILDLDTIRKQIGHFESNASNGGSTSTPSISVPTGNVTTPSFQPAFVPQYQQPVAQPLFPSIGLSGEMPLANQYSPLMMYPAYVGSDVHPADANQFNRDAQVFVPRDNHTNGTQYLPNGLSIATQPPLSPASASRRSHAIEIKPPRDDRRQAPALGSSLDPKSPTYQPSMKIHAPLPVNNAYAPPPSPSPAKRSHWRSHENTESASDKYERALSQKPSLSSIDTQDFFPTNTHEHSSTRVDPTKLTPAKQPSRGDMIDPSTPDKSWPPSPWNPQPSSGTKTQQGSRNGSMRKLTSWTEQFRGELPERPTMASLIPRTDPKVLREYEANVALAASSRKASAQQSSSATDQSWRIMATPQVSHLPSTYQEGFQAGFDHLGLPRNPDVLRGFVEGLETYLKESSMASNVATASISSRPSRDQLTGGAIYDSAISMGFPRSGLPINKSENIRSATFGNGRSPDLQGATNGLGGMALEPSARISNENAQSMRARQFPVSKSKGVRDAFDKYVFSQQQDATTTDQDALKHQTIRQAQADVALQALGYPRQYSGNALGGASNSPVGMQRFQSVMKAPGMASYNSSSKPVFRQQVSNMDGAADDQPGMMAASSVEDTKDVAVSPKTASAGSGGQEKDTEDSEQGASCFRSSSKGKGKAPTSPTKSSSGTTWKGSAASSPSKVSDSTKKSGEHSPAKAKLESVTNKFRRSRPLSPEAKEKQRRVQKWHKRFKEIKETEKKEIEEYKRTHPSNE